MKLMFVNYPQMPTGKLPSKKLFEKIVAFGKKHRILIIHDNPYSFILNEAPMSLLRIEAAKDCVIELNSLSKSHNMAGWRVGMLCGAKVSVDTAHRLKALGLVDKIVSEPVGGAQRDPRWMAAALRRALNDALRQVADLKPKELLQRRYDRLQSYGRFSDTKER